MTLILQHSWARAWQGVGADDEGEPVRAALAAAYAEPQRKYHCLQHLTECLEWFERVRELPGHAAEVELALWFHDAVYDVKGSDNEQRSADWAAAELVKAGVAPEVIGRVSALILATKHTAVPTEPDQQVLVDIDLAILGAAEPRFAEYGQQIRDEYAFVPEELFKPRRRALLGAFLDRPRIYSTSYFHALLEERARTNLGRALGACISV